MANGSRGHCCRYQVSSTLRILASQEMPKSLLNELLEPFTDCVDRESAQRVADFQIAPSVQKRVDALAERANEGQLTEAPRMENEALINAADFIAILKLKARRRLKTSIRDSFRDERSGSPASEQSL